MQGTHAILRSAGEAMSTSQNLHLGNSRHSEERQRGDEYIAESPPGQTKILRSAQNDGGTVVGPGYY
jgi:hypothetical protein